MLGPFEFIYIFVCTCTFSEITTPNKDHPGITKTVFTHVSNLHGLLGDWSRVKDKGTKFCRGILALKLYECTDDYYPHQLQPLTEGLLEALDSMKNIMEGNFYGWKCNYVTASFNSHVFSKLKANPVVVWEYR